MRKSKRLKVIIILEYSKIILILCGLLFNRMSLLINYYLSDPNEWAIRSHHDIEGFIKSYWEYSAIIVGYLIIDIIVILGLIKLKKWSKYICIFSSVIFLIYFADYFIDMFKRHEQYYDKLFEFAGNDLTYIVIAIISLILIVLCIIVKIKPPSISETSKAIQYSENDS